MRSSVQYSLRSSRSLSVLSLCSLSFRSLSVLSPIFPFSPCSLPPFSLRSKDIIQITAALRMNSVNTCVRHTSGRSD